MDADAVFHQQHHELFSVHQGDGSFVGLSCFLDGSGTESNCEMSSSNSPGFMVSRRSRSVVQGFELDEALRRKSFPQLDLQSNRISSKTQPQRKRPVDLHHGCFVKNADDFAYFFGRNGLNFIDHDL